MTIPDEPSQGAATDPATDPATELAVVAARAADHKLATDIIVLDVGPAIGICDHFVVASAANERQVKAVVDGIEEAVRTELGITPRAEEGKDARRWVLLDFGDVIVHVFHVEERSYYRLERLYGDVSRTDWHPDGHPDAGTA